MTILKGIPRILPPQLLYVLASMGHGDEIVLADANFPAASIAAAAAGGTGANNATAGTQLIYCDGLGVPELLNAICQLLPLDTTYSDFPAAVMQVVPNDVGKVETPVWEEYKTILKAAAAEGQDNIELEQVERFAFYERAKKAFAVVATGESALYGNLILKKGVLGPEKRTLDELISV